MSVPREPYQAMLIAGILRRPAVPGTAVAARLESAFGPIAAASAEFAFDLTTYYAAEMGPSLVRSFVAFSRLVKPDDLASLKLRANEIEHEFLDGPDRMLNVDPGILTGHNVVLATAKDYSHRIYLRDGIYAQVTLIAHKAGFEPLPWTYPDYRLPLTLEFFNAQRVRLCAERRMRGTTTTVPASPSPQGG